MTEPSTGLGQELTWAQEVERTTAFWQPLGLPGLLDVHTHFLPPPVQAKVWQQFDNAGPKLGREWPIRYRGSVEERVAQLRELGVRRFSTLPYAHRPGIARYLNEWAAGFKRDVPESLWSATLYPEDDVAAYVAEGIAAGVEIWKVHVQVGEFHLDDPALDPAWALLAEVGTPVVVHAGHAPVGNDYTGHASSARVLERHPGLAMVVAHMGAPDFTEFLDLADRYEQVRLDTTMVFTDFELGDAHGGPPAYADGLLDRLDRQRDRLLLGTDFPTIPYPYVHQLESLERLGLGDDWLRAVCWHNAAALVGAGAEYPLDPGR